MWHKLNSVVLLSALALLALGTPAQGDVFNMPSGLTSLEFVPVGNPGNPADDSGCGAVGYDYQIGKYEVTNSQYCEFLNAKAPTDTYGLYNTSMSSDARGGINRSGIPGSHSYSVKSGHGNMAVMFVSWFDAVRFANWLTNGQGNGNTETGSYTITGGGYNSGVVSAPSAAQRATWAIGSTRYWLLPSEDEWYKAAYYQPATQGGDSDDYWLYPTRTNSKPYSAQPPGSSAPAQWNTANFYKMDSVSSGYDDGYAVTGSPSYVDTQNYLTEVGAYTQSVSYYGSFDQGGNVREWNEAINAQGSRCLRGGSWVDDQCPDLSARGQIFAGPSYEDSAIRLAGGFRVASVPEPGSISLLVCGAVAGLIWWRRRMYSSRSA